MRSQDFTLWELQIEALKAPSGMGSGEGISPSPANYSDSFDRRYTNTCIYLSIYLGGLGERRELPQQGPGGAFFGIFEVHRTLLGKITLLLY